MKKILVAGGAGFLGVNLCHRLILEYPSVEIICLDNLCTSQKSNIEGFKNYHQFKFIEADITNDDLLDLNVDWIFNLACPASPIHYQKKPISTTLTNVVGTFNLLRLAQKCNAKILQASTSEVYGDPQEHPQKETYWGHVNTIGVRSCYDEGKRCAESLMFDFHRMYGIRVKVVRIFNIYGPHMSLYDGRVVVNFIVQCLTGKPLTIYGAGDQTRSLCYVDDLIEGIIRMMNSDDKFCGPVNLGNPEELTVNEIAKKILMIANPNAVLKYVSLPSDDPVRRKPDISLAKDVLAWTPTTSLDAGIRKTVDWFKSEMGVK